MSEHEQWDITSGVGITALAVAAARAVTTDRDAGLVNDPFAESFVQAADSPVPMCTRLPDEPMPDSTYEQMWHAISVHMGLRSRYFDDYFAEAVASGVRQVVVLAAGLDTRAFRLDWPAGCTVFEVDQPRVLEFKDEVLREQGAAAGCDRRIVPVDLRDDWRAALLEQGFDSSRPTAWLAEGLLPYLPMDAERRLLDVIHELSVPGSRISIEYLLDTKALLDHPLVTESAREFGFDIRELFHTKAPTDPASRLTELGWAVNTTDSGELAERYDREHATVLTKEFQDFGRYLTAER
ncbi:MAG: SAM-dependent methyltransferase [Pseudonocardiaceae bacterium]|nr:SAM-dependent methyltransferase [Pseudonocardiaceae bacterium]